MYIQPLFVQADLTLMRMDVLEMKILYEELIHYILFHFFSFFILSPSLLLSCSVPVQRFSRRSPVSQRVWAARGAGAAGAGFLLMVL